MTGRYHYRSRVVDTYCGRSIMDASETTLADLLSASGYRTALFGKWHLGDTAPFRPEDRGFQETVWHLGGGIGQPGDHPSNWGRDSYFDPMLCESGVFRLFRGYCTDVFTAEACSFMRRNSGNPWFAYVGFNAPHTPVQVDVAAAERCRQRGASGDVAGIYAMVENIDANVGRMLDALRDSGQLANTVIVFTSDHGICRSVRDADGALRFNAGLRGSKGSPYEGGIRVPCLWHWPAAIQAGTTIQQPTHAVDILPTFLSAARVEVPASPALDGLDLMPLLGGRPEPWPDRILFQQWHRGDLPICRRNCMATTANRKWVCISEAEPGQLFDIENDPFETTDISAKEPSTLERLRAAYDEWFSAVSSPHGFAPIRIPVSSDAMPLVLTRQDWRVDGEDGWGPTHLGHWLLQITNPGIYRLRIHFDSAPPEPGTFQIVIGSHRISRFAPVGRAEFEATVDLPLGAVDLSSTWQTAYGAGSAFRIVIDSANSV